jgi:hypothetical protein
VREGVTDKHYALPHGRATASVESMMSQTCLLRFRSLAPISYDDVYLIGREALVNAILHYRGENRERNE